MKEKHPFVQSKVERLLDGSLESLFWIGLLYCDGHIENNKRLILQLQERDSLFFMKFAEYINSASSVKVIKARPFKFSGVSNYKIQTQNSLRIQVQDSFNIPQIVNRFDFKQTKTYNPPAKSVFENFSRDELMAVLLGMICGDGSVEPNGGGFTIGLCSHHSWIEIYTIIVNTIKEMGFSTQKITTLDRDGYDRMIRLRIGDRNFMRFINSFIVDNNLPVLERKFEIIKQIPLSSFEKSELRKNKCIPHLLQGKSVSETAKITSEKYVDVFYIKQKYL